MTALEFLSLHGRLPRLGDEQPPWTYGGFLLPYVMLAHDSGMCSGRWGYYARLREANRLTDEAIPAITFSSPDPKIESMITEWSRLVGWDMGGWSDFSVLLDWLCFALSISQEYPRSLSDAASEKLYRQVNLGPLLAQSYDYLGQYVASNRARGWNPNAFYPTPHPVVECMVQMQAADYRGDARSWRVCDPCVGSGRMLLHASNVSLRLYGMDIDSMCVKMTLINGALYAPWITFPLPESFFGEEKTYLCRHCGNDLGWDRPSGVCSETCLRQAQGFSAQLELFPT